MTKVSVIGAGNVGATCAEYIALRKIASEVVILDIKENFSILSFGKKPEILFGSIEFKNVSFSYPS